MLNLLFILFAVTLLMFAIPLRWKGLFASLLVVAGAGITSLPAFEVLIGGNELAFNLFPSSFSGGPDIRMDRLSGFFILIINITALTGVLYAPGYLKSYIGSHTPLRFSIHYFSWFWLWISMVLLTMIRDSFAFLVVWEFMTLSSFLLVVFNAEDRKILKTGVNYLIQMHVGMMILMVAFMITGTTTGISGFDGVGEYFRSHPNWPVFTLFFIGFGIKAGFIPFHTWLPQAHPAAPSHVSGLMSGVMIKMGIFGIVRIIDVLQTDLMAIGLMVLSFSLISGLIGVMMAIVQHDLKRLLAFHSIENIGIIGIGLGLGIVGMALGNQSMQILGFTGGLLHVLNHSLFKSILFFSAGSVYKATHTRNIDSLGGLIKRMPWTALFFLVGSLAITGLPPFNGFISEYLIFTGAFKSLHSASLYEAIVLLFSLAGLALIGGLALFCFTKAFGIVFLGEPRSAGASGSVESDRGMILPQLIPLILIFLIGLAPTLFVKPLIEVTCDLANIGITDTGFLPYTHNLGRISLAAGIFVALAVGLWILRYWVLKNRPAEIQPTWGCGFTEGDSKQQYTATSYADNYGVLANPLLRIRKETEPIRTTELFPEPRSFKTTQIDILRVWLVEKPVNMVTGVLKRLAVMQTGQIQHYILYAFVFMIVIFLLTFFNLI